MKRATIFYFHICNIIMSMTHMIKSVKPLTKLFARDMIIKRSTENDPVFLFLKYIQFTIEKSSTNTTSQWWSRFPRMLGCRWRSRSERRHWRPWWCTVGQWYPQPRSRTRTLAWSACWWLSAPSLRLQEIKQSSN